LIYGDMRGGIDGSEWTPNDAPTRVVGPQGIATRFTAGSSQALAAPIRGINSSDMTLYVIARLRATVDGVNQAIISLGEESGYERTLLYWAAGSGVIRLSLFIGNAYSFRQTACPAIAWTDTENYYVFVARVSDATSGFGAWYGRDGSFESSTITDLSTVAAGTPSRVAIGGYFYNGGYIGNFFASQDVAVAGVLPYAVSESQRLELLARLDSWLPYIEPRTQYIPTASGVLVPTLSLATVTSITATTARPRVTITF
jgi:hypothetical protein